MTHVRVKPAREGESLSHPLDGPLAPDGGLWRRDQFTFKRLNDGDVIEIDENGDPVKPAASEPADQPAMAEAGDPAKAQLPASLAGRARPTAIPSPAPAAADSPKE